jgi:hypothetical protein
MSTMQTIARILAVLFLLGGLLLLQKPIFGQAILAVPTRQFDASVGQLIESSRTTVTSNAYRSNN